MKSWSILSALLAFSVVFGGCKNKKPEPSAVSGIEECAGMFGPEYQACINGDAIDLTDVVALGNLGAGGLLDLFGAPYFFKADGLCLSAEDWGWHSCEIRNDDQRFHFFDVMKIKYQLVPGYTLNGAAFRIATRQSVRAFSQAEECSDEVKSNCIVVEKGQSLNEATEVVLRCLGFDDNGRPQTMVCENAPYFTDIPSPYDEDPARKEENRYISLAVLDKDSALLSKESADYTEAMKEFQNSQNAFVFTIDDTKEPDPPLADLGSLVGDGDKGCQRFRMVHFTDDRRLRAECLAKENELVAEQAKRRSSRLFLYGCPTARFDQSSECREQEGYPDAVKKLYEDFVTVDSGTVGQILSKQNVDQCAYLEQGKLVNNGKCSQNRVDDDTTQFRMIYGDHKDNGEIYVKFSRLHNSARCIDLTKMNTGQPAEADCGDIEPYQLDPAIGDIRSGKDFYTFKTCLATANHKVDIAYDCVYNTAAKWKLLEKLSLGLGFLAVLALPIGGGPGVLAAIILSTPSYVMDGILCGKGPPEVRMGGCIGIGIGIGIDAVAGPLSLGNPFRSSRAASAGVAKPGISVKNLSLESTLGYMLRAIGKRGAFAPVRAQVTFNLALAKMILKKPAKYNRDFLKRLFAKVRTTKPHGANVRNPLVNIPPPDEMDTFFNNVVQSVKNSDLAEADKGLVLEALK